MLNTIKFAKLKDDAKIPNKRVEDAGFDIYPCFEDDYLIVRPHETKMIPTGIISAFSDDYVMILKERGSTGTKGIGQRCGVIDSGFRGEWQVPITNHSEFYLVIIKEGVTKKPLANRMTGFCNKEGAFVFKNDFWERAIIYPYEKAICQALLLPVPKVEVEECTVDEIMNIESERGTGMLGSSTK